MSFQRTGKAHIWGLIFKQLNKTEQEMKIEDLEKS